MKRVLDVGQCAADHYSLRRLIEGSFDAELVPAHDARVALEALRGGGFDLVLVNRLFDADGSDGLELIRAFQADEALRATPVMLVTNYPEYQEQAVAAGAVPGFGKAALHQPETRERLARILA